MQNSVSELESGTQLSTDAKAKSGEQGLSARLDGQGTTPVRALIEPEPVRTAAELLEIGFWKFSKKSLQFVLSKKSKELLGADTLSEALDSTDLNQLLDLATQKEKLIFTARTKAERPANSDEPGRKVVFRGWIEYRGATRLVGTLTPLPDEDVVTAFGPEPHPLLVEAMELGRDSLLVMQAVRNEIGIPVDFEVVEANSMGAQLLGGSRDSVKGRLLRQLLPSVEEDGTLTRYAEILASGEAVENEFHASPGGFQRIWIKQRVVPLENGLAIFASDVSGSKIADELADRSRKMFEQIAATTPDALFLWDVNTRRVIYRNRQLATHFSLPSDFAAMAPLSALESQLEPDSRIAFLDYVAELETCKGEAVIECLVQATPELGRRIRLLLRSSVFDRKANGSPKSILAAVQDVTAQVEYRVQLEQRMKELDIARAELEVQHRELVGLNAQLSDMALTDATTGIKNRRAFQEKLEEESERAQRYNSRLALLLTDIDHFKRYNDSYGHPAGDDALKAFAQVLLDVCRRSDTVARYGGEEFAIILPNTGAQEAGLLGERIRHALAQTALGRLGVTASVGCAEFLPGKEGRDRLVLDSDRALYQSKEQGRDRVTVFGA